MNEAEYTSEMAEGLLSLGKKKLFGFAGVLSGVFGFIADVLQPIAPFALYLAIICAIGLLVSLCLYIKSKKGLTISIVLAVSTGVLGLLSAVQHFSGSTDKGWASKRIPGVSRFQESLGMLLNLSMTYEIQSIVISSITIQLPRQISIIMLNFTS